MIKENNFQLMDSVTNIKGGISKDSRGQIRFVNDFDMTDVKRFYIITNADTDLIRGWRAHRIEQRWFYVLRGSFVLDVVRIDNWENPSNDLPVERLILNSADQEVVHLPAGFCTAFRAMADDSELLVFADKGIEHAPLDNYTYPPDYFVNRK